MPGWNGTLAQRFAVGFGVFFGVFGVIGLIIHPDFGTGADLSSEQFAIDWNGWHAVSSLALAATAFVTAARPVWARAFLLGNAIGNGTTAVWAMFDSTPLGVLDLPNVATDVVLHFAVTAVSGAAYFTQRSRDRRRRAARSASES
jgi:hypothetical protein